MNLATELAALSDREWAARPAFHTGDRTWTHGEVHDTAARAATVLARRGVRPGHRVLIALTDGIGWVLAFLGAVRIGATPVPVNPAVTADDHHYQVGDCDPALVVTSEDLLDRFDGVAAITADRLLAEAVHAERGQAAESRTPLYIYYTSGTTGRPKGVMYRPGTPAAYHRLIGEDCFGLTGADVTLSVSKLYFGYGFCNTLVFPLYSGSSAVLIGERPMPGLAGELAARYGVTMLYAVPSWYARLRADGHRAAFGTVRAAVSGGERFPADLTRRTEEFLGAPVLDQLGATEVGCAICANSVAHHVPGTVGRPLRGVEVQLRDADGRPVGDETEGDMFVRGPVMMTGYLGAPEASARALAGGWFRTNDRAVRHADGTYTHRGRADDTEMVGGITLQPSEVEDVLGDHPGVREVAVAAVPDALGATKLRAFVVTSDGHHDETALEAELIALARSRLAPFKVPRSVRFVDALPRTPSGKLRRFLLRGQPVR